MEKRMFRTIALLLGIVILFAASYSIAKEKKDAAKLTHKTVELQLALRDLWAGHIFWVRNVVLMTKLGESDGAKVAEDMVVKNAHALADSVIPYYGNDASGQLFNLLAGHYGAIKDYMTATYSGDATAQNTASDKLKTNADQIASFLNSANPKNWPKETLVGLLTAHGTHHMTQIDDINKKDFAAEAQNWVDMKKNVYQIADALAEGIVKQFPKKF